MPVGFFCRPNWRFELIIIHLSRQRQVDRGGDRDAEVLRAPLRRRPEQAQPAYQEQDRVSLLFASNTSTHIGSFTISFIQA